MRRLSESSPAAGPCSVDAHPLDPRTTFLVRDLPSWRFGSVKAPSRSRGGGAPPHHQNVRARGVKAHHVIALGVAPGAGVSSQGCWTPLRAAPIRQRVRANRRLALTADVGAGSRPRPHHRAKTVASRAGYRPPTDEESPSSGEDFEVNGPPKRRTPYLLPERCRERMTYKEA